MAVLGIDLGKINCGVVGFDGEGRAARIVFAKSEYARQISSEWDTVRQPLP